MKIIPDDDFIGSVDESEGERDNIIVSPYTAGESMPKWLPIAAIALIAFFLLRK
jgi:hypothetical protein